MKKRIWELDALRGLCIIVVVIIHLIFDLVMLRLIVWDYPQWYEFLKNWGGVIFLLLSGVCVTLGSHSIRRGLIVLGCGMLITTATYGITHIGIPDDIIIFFGVLHCLGICMLLWSMFKNVPWWGLLIQGILLAVLGIYIMELMDANQLSTTAKWLMPLGIYWKGFSSSDYFPLLPHFGFFLIGAALGKTLYKNKVSLLPMVNEKNFILRFFCF